MKSSIYISTDKVEVIGYKNTRKGLVVKDAVSAALPEGVAINGKLLNPQHLAETLAGLRENRPALFKNASLVVDGSAVMSRRVKTPRLSKKQYRRLVRDEFADSAEEADSLVCDYVPIKNSKGKHTSILATAMESGQLENYLAAFREAGIKLRAVRAGVWVILDYVSSRQDLRGEAIILNVVDGITMLSMIIADGDAVFMSRVRLYGETNEQIAQNISHNLSGLMQFIKSQKIENVSRCLYLGVDEDAVAVMRELNPYDELEIEQLTLPVLDTTETVRLDWHFAVLGAMSHGGGIDLLRGRESLRKMKKPKSKLLPAAVAVAVVTAAVFASAAYLTTRINDIDEKLAEINSFVLNPDNAALSVELDKMTAETQRMSEAVNQISEKEQTESAEAGVSRAFIEFVIDSARGSVALSGFSFSSGGVLNVSCNCTTDEANVNYVERLQAATELISSVVYTGFSYNEESGYNFSLEIRAAAPSGTE